jgi:hypothetical protein
MVHKRSGEVGAYCCVGWSPDYIWSGGARQILTNGSVFGVDLADFTVKILK